MEFTREVHSSAADYGVPIEMKVTLTDAEVERIRYLAAQVITLKVYKICVFDYSPDWFGPENEDPEDKDNSFGDADCVLLNVTEDEFWWSANLKHTGIGFYGEHIKLSELPE